MGTGEITVDERGNQGGIGGERMGYNLGMDLLQLLQWWALFEQLRKCGGILEK